MSHEMSFNAGAEVVQRAEGNMSGAVMRGTAALPGSETNSRTKGSRRNLGDLLSPVAAQAASGRGGKLNRAKPPRKAGGVGRLHSTDEAPNKADHVGGGGCGGKAAGRGEGKLRRMTRHVTEAASLRAGGAGPFRSRTPVAFDPRQEPGAGKPHAGICGGGAG